MIVEAEASTYLRSNGKSEAVRFSQPMSLKRDMGHPHPDYLRSIVVFFVVFTTNTLGGTFSFSLMFV